MTRLKENSCTRCCIERRNCKLLATTVDRCKLLATLIPTSAKQIIPQQVGRYFQQFAPRSLSNHALLFIFSFWWSFSIFQKDPTGFTQAAIYKRGAQGYVMGSWWLSSFFDHCVVLSASHRRKDQKFKEFFGTFLKILRLQSCAKECIV